jgi:hypothetical protein
LPRVPIDWPAGGGYFLAFGLSAGDPVAVVFCDVATGEALDSGDVGAPVDTRRHGLAYSHATPGGMRPTPRRLVDAPTSGAVLGKDGSDSQVVIEDTMIQLGKGATDFVALAAKVEIELGKIANTFSTFLPGTGGASFPVPYTAPAANSTGATLVKAK